MNPYGLLCSGLLLLITVRNYRISLLTLLQIAEKESGRREELSNALEYLYQQSEQLAIVEVLPDDIEQTETLTNRALDVRTASMVFLAAHICHDKTPLGTLG